MPFSPTDFKILAIKPGKECSVDYTKILTREEYYYFYSGYKILEEKITYQKQTSDGLFDLGQEQPKINVSAIVGKNGTGKSTIIELLFMAINNISIKFFHNQIRRVTPKLKLVEKLDIDLYIQKDGVIYLFSLNNANDKITRYYRIDDSTFLLDDSNYTIDNHLNDFFYSIAVNYSHYSLNSNDLGFWIEKLFHKNDGYQTPLVINPMRTAGVIDINDENHLVMARLITNLLVPAHNNKSHWRLTDKQTAKNLLITLNPEKIDVVYYEKVPENKTAKYIPITFKDSYFKLNHRRLMNLVYKEFGNPHPDFDSSLKKDLEKYIIKKLVKIARTYPEYQKYYSSINIAKLSTKKTHNAIVFSDSGSQQMRLYTGFGDLGSEFKSYLKKLRSDGSHITFKLKQALNFLLLNPLAGLKEKVSINYNQTVILPLDILSTQLLELKELHNESLINLLPPSLFKLDLSLEATNGELSKFSSLSSGEKQLIHTSNSVYYHLINLDSVFNKRHGRLKAKYNCVGIILEEIELYFHPESQRKYVKYILDGLKRLGLQNISGINICFVTHSPYILSDMPRSNIMFLDIDDETGLTVSKNVQMNTFGTNINDLLSNGFFMAQGLIGEFAQRKIQEVIDTLTNKKNELGRQEMLNIISIIGEPYLRDKLKQMYYDKYPEEFTSEKDRLRKIQELEEELSRLKKA